MANIIQTGTSVESYSTDETVIGKWIDGSTLYRKVIEVTNITVPAPTYNFANIKYIVRQYGYLVGKSKNRIFPMISADEPWVASVDEYDTTKITFHFGASIRNEITSAVIVIEYIKTSNH